MIPGAEYSKEKGCTFTVWAPHRKRIQLLLTEEAERVDLQRVEHGYWQVTIADLGPDTDYKFVLDEELERPDPASHFQPEGVHGPSRVVDHNAYKWSDTTWPGVPPEKMVTYELHVGTFTPEGTFAAAAKRLDDLADLGINATEVMPVSQFPGSRNWGYDGAYIYAVQNSYGGPEAFKAFVDNCHQKGIAVVLDVVYNHMGPEGNYIRDFGPYFGHRYNTPWGDSMNFDNAYSDQVRDFFFENALHWFRNYDIDALRLDALHAIYDRSAKHFLAELVDRVEELHTEKGRKRYLIGESDLNDVRLILPRRWGGYGLDAQWSDDFHHSLHALITAEDSGYYKDFGQIGDLEKAYTEGFVYDWRYSKHRKRHHGSNSAGRPARQLVVCIQNHDQIGNRMLGERLSQLVDFEPLKLAAGAVLLSPYPPLLFMGEEYAEDAPFQYFVSHTDEELVEAVRKGRQAEFESFEWEGAFPDPQAEETFERCILQWDKRKEGSHGVMLEFYRRLIAIRNRYPEFVNKKGMRVRSVPQSKLLIWKRQFVGLQLQCVMNFSDSEQRFSMSSSREVWMKILDSAETKWAGSGTSLPSTVKSRRRLTIQPFSLALFERGRKFAEEAEQATAEAVLEEES